MEPLTFQANDVLFGKGGTRHTHPGNVKLKEMAERIREAYNQANPLDKRPIVSALIGSIHESGGRFLKYDQKKKVWRIADPLSAHDKVLQQIVPNITDEEEAGEECPSQHWHAALVVDPPIVPHQNDILMGRGGNTNLHAGNQNLRRMALSLREKYATSRKKEKTIISRELVRKVKESDPPGRFLCFNKSTQAWTEIGDENAREKVGQVLRDAVAERAGLKSMAEEPAAEPQKHRPAATAPAIAPDFMAIGQNNTEMRVQPSDASMQSIETFSLSSASNMTMNTAGVFSGNSIRTDSAVSNERRHVSPSAEDYRIALILAQQKELIDQCNHSSNNARKP